MIILGRQVPTAHGGILDLACGRSTAFFSRAPQGAVLVVVVGNGFGECCDTPAGSLNALESDLLEITLSITDAVS
jgi:hypothetical protein